MMRKASLACVGVLIAFGLTWTSALAADPLATPAADPLASPAASAAPAAAATIPTLLSLTMPSSLPEGVGFTITARLTAGGQPVAGEMLRLFIDGIKRHEERTDANGVAGFKRVGNVAAHEYRVTVAYSGNPGSATVPALAPASATSDLTILDTAILLALPSPTPAGQRAQVSATLMSGGAPMPGVSLTLSMNGQKWREAKTNAAGTARFDLGNVLAAGSYTVTVQYSGQRRHGRVARPIFASTSGGVTVLADGLTLNVPPAAAPGQKFEVVAQLMSAGAPMAGVDLHLFVDGVARRLAKTRADGTASFALRGTLAAGSHRFTVSYFAAHRRGAAAPVQPFATASSTMLIRPLILSVQTVPIIAGVTFLADGRSFVSDAKGVASIAIPTAGIHKVSVLLHDPDASTRIEFARWGDDAFTAARQVRMETDVSLSVGLRLAYLTRIGFMDQRGPLDLARISNVVLSGPDAEVLHLEYPYPAVWLHTPVPTKRSGADGLYITPAPYTVTSADFEGLSVVARGEVRYTPGPGNGVWMVPLRLYTMRIHAKDALLGLSISQPAIVTDPNRQKRRVVLDAAGNATIIAGRGTYTVRVLAGAISPLTPVALTKDQLAVVVPIVSVLDLGIIGSAALGALVVLFLIGRRRNWVAMLAGSVSRRRFASSSSVSA